MLKPKWGLFFDFHTMPANPEVGKHFPMDKIIAWFEDCGADFVVFPARCNMGTAYYPTKLGIPHPSLKRDLFGDLVKACRDKGIAVSAYINVGLSHEEAYRRRDWTILREDGRMYGENFRDVDSFFRQMCYNTGYAEHVSAMAREVVELYDVDGFFFDCFHTQPCIGIECMEKMKEEGVDWSDPAKINDFNYRKVISMAGRLTENVRAAKSGLLIYYNGVDFEAQAELGTYLELECLPQGSWGYELLPMAARYMRTLGKPVLNMTGRFQKSWGDFGGIRTVPSVEYDCIMGIANCVPPTIGDHFHPRGDLNNAVIELDKAVYGRLKPLEPWIDGAEPVVEMANIMSLDYPGLKYEQESINKNRQSVKSATRMLSELKMQFDNVTLAADWEKYKILVLPDDVRLNSDITSRLRKHIHNGGSIIASCESGLDESGAKFVMEEWGVEYRGPDTLNPAYIEFDPVFSEGMPDMPVTLYETGLSVAPRPGAETLATITSPYYNCEWDGRHGFRYTPPDKPSGRPAVVINSGVAYISHPVFRIYHVSGTLPMRQILANLLARFLPEPLMKTPGAPSYSRVTVTSQPGRRMVYVMAYLPESRGENINMIEEPLELNDFEVCLRLDGRTPKKVYLAPGRQPLDFYTEGNYTVTRMPVVKGWAVAVFEE